MLTKATQFILSEIDRDMEVCDPVWRNYTYHAFTSRSKGGHVNKIVKSKSGKIYGPYPKYGPYKRKNWKDVELIKYRDSGFKQWEHFPFDEYATETFPGWEEYQAIEEIQERLRKFGK